MAFFGVLGFCFDPRFRDDAMDPIDHRFMYGWSFYDLDGHHWEVLWLDPAAAH